MRIDTFVGTVISSCWRNKLSRSVPNNLFSDWSHSSFHETFGGQRALKTSWYIRNLDTHLSHHRRISARPKTQNLKLRVQSFQMRMELNNSKALMLIVVSWPFALDSGWMVSFQVYYVSLRRCHSQNNYRSDQFAGIRFGDRSIFEKLTWK